jgi:transcriptional regulator with XRE-family HTH domain
MGQFGFDYEPDQGGPRTIQRNYTDPTTGNTTQVLRSVDENYKPRIGETLHDDQGDYTEDWYRPNPRDTSYFQGAVPAAVGGALTGLASNSFGGNASHYGLAGAIGVGSEAFGNIGAQHMEQQHPGSKRHAVMAGALKTGLRRGGEAFLRNLPAGITPALASAGLAGTVGGLEGAVGSMPGGESLARAVNPLLGGLVQGDFRGGLAGAAMNVLQSPTLRKDLTSLANLRKAKPEEYHGGTWGAGTYPHAPTPATAEPSPGMILDKDSPLYPKLPPSIRQRILELNARGMGMTPQMLEQWAREGDRPSLQALETIRAEADNVRLKAPESIYGPDMQESEAQDLFEYLRDGERAANDFGMDADDQEWKEMGFIDPNFTHTFAEQMAHSDSAANRANLKEIIRRLNMVRKMRERNGFAGLYHYMKKRSDELGLPDGFNPRQLATMSDEDYDNYQRMMLQEVYGGDYLLADTLRADSNDEIGAELDRVAQERYGEDFGHLTAPQQKEVDRDVYQAYIGEHTNLANEDDYTDAQYWQDNPITAAEDVVLDQITGGGHTDMPPSQQYSMIYGLRRAQKGMFTKPKTGRVPLETVEGAPLPEEDRLAQEALRNHEQLDGDGKIRLIREGSMYDPEAQGEEYQNDAYMRKRATPLPLNEATDLGGKYFDALSAEREKQEKGALDPLDWYGGPEWWDGSIEIGSDGEARNGTPPASYSDMHIVRGEDGHQYIRLAFGNKGKGYLRIPTAEDEKYGDVFRHITNAMASGHIDRAQSLYNKLRGYHRGFRINRRPTDYKWNRQPTEQPGRNPTQEALLDRLFTARGPEELEEVMRQIDVAQDESVNDGFKQEARQAMQRIAAAWTNRRSLTKDQKTWEKHNMPKPKDNPQQGVTKE